MPGTLIVVGTGIRAVGHLTVEAREWIAAADVVFDAVADPLTEREIRRLHPSAVSLNDLYADGRRRRATYDAMVERILGALADDRVVCAVFYGHPGVFVAPSHEAVARARALGHHAELLPAVSAEDCLLADLGVDPARTGLASFEATDLLVRRRRWDPHAALVVWQIGVVGNLGVPRPDLRGPGLVLLAEVLAEEYGPEHVVVVYEAATIPGCDPLVHHVRLADLPDAPVTTLSTLYVPPRGRAQVDPERAARLGLTPGDFGA